MLNGRQRAALRKEANALAPAFQIGKAGMEENLRHAVLACLKKRELVKLKLLENCPLAPRETADAMGTATGAEVIQVVGRVFVLFLKKGKDSAFGELLQR